VLIVKQIQTGKQAMPIITLTTDFGTDNWFVGSMKGVIYSIAPHSTVIDLNHGITKYNIRQTSFSLMASIDYFPTKSIHVVVVDPGVGSNRRPIVAVTEKHIFVAPDNGVLTPFINQPNCQIYQAANKKYFMDNISNTFHGRDIFAPIAAHIANGIPIENIGKIITDPVLVQNNLIINNDNNLLPPRLTANILLVDSFGNLITNIHKSIITNKNNIKIKINDYEIDGISKNYDNGLKGEPLAVIGSSGFLEVAVNQGNASSFFNCSIDDQLEIIIKD